MTEEMSCLFPYNEHIHSRLRENYIENALENLTVVEKSSRNKSTKLHEMY